MKSIKELSTETKILDRLKNIPICLEMVKYLFADEELQEMQEYANNVSIRRLGFNDHGPVHMRQVVGNAIKMLNILHEAGIRTSLEIEEIGTFEDSMCAVILAGLMHDLGMAIGRQGHEEMSVLLAQPIIDRTLLHVFPDNLHRRVIIKSVATEAIIGHMSSRKIHSIEAGILLIADGCDMTKGRARIPMAINTTPKVGDIHKYSANAINRIGIHRGERKPIKIDIEMSGDVGFFQIEEVLLTKIDSSPSKEYVELYAGVAGQERKCYL
ncbi:TPA: phosphohydrolase [Candidatus Gastranaerophilales bacterium HUM_20]|nr:metal dependent phosphohydrolase [Clostridium sp. CAG:729]DAB24712.1 MAG TPA: phosphohydrolase [Candidatus Gastranaerophilales bacterium HUM_20]